MSLLRPRSQRLSTVTLSASLLLALSSAATVATASEPMQLRTDRTEVRGTHEVESGNYQAGIQKLQATLLRTSKAQGRAPILNNLCVAYIATQDLDNAFDYCEQAVQNGRNLSVAYNNRGVLKVVTGQPGEGIADLHLANIYSHDVGVAKSNLARLAD